MAHLDGTPLGLPADPDDLTLDAEAAAAYVAKVDADEQVEVTATLSSTDKAAIKQILGVLDDAGLLKDSSTVGT